MTEWNPILGALLLLVAAVYAQDIPPEVAAADVGGETAVDRILKDGDEPPVNENEMEMEPTRREEEDRQTGTNEMEMEPILRDDKDRHGGLILTSLECSWHSLCYLMLLLSIYGFSQIFQHPF